MALGVDFGDALMSADVRMNARGFFEDVDVVALDDALLDANAADWKSVALLADVDWSAELFAGLRSAAGRLLAARVARSGTFGFKDPRVPRVLPFWQRVAAAAGLADSYVIAVRHPQAVIDSLTARDDLAPRRSALLWLTHLVCALRYARGRPCVVADYDRMLAQPVQELARIARALALPRPPGGEEEIRQYAEHFLTTELRHAQYARDAVDAAALPPWIADAHALAQDLAGDEAQVDSDATIARVDALFGHLLEWAPLLSYAAAVERAADEIPHLAGELAWARASLADATTYNEDLRRALETSETYSGDLEATLDRKERELVHAHGILDRLRERAIGRMLLRDIHRKG
jgi:hypothetical protein